MNLEKQEVERLLVTLREYTEKLDAIMKEIQSAELNTKSGMIKANPNFPQWVAAQKQYVFKMRPAIHDLIRLASQLTTHSGLSDIDRTTVRVRMADLEATGDKVYTYLVQHK